MPLPAARKTKPAAAAVAEILWLEAQGAQIGGNIGVLLHNWCAGKAAAAARERRDAELIFDACRAQFSPFQQALAAAILGEGEFPV